MKYKTIMLDLPLFARLSNAKTVLSSKVKRDLSFGDFLRELLSDRMDLLDIDNRLKHYIAKFSEELSTIRHVQGTILFGSVAKESFDENSDIDVLILIDDSASRIMIEVAEVMKNLKNEGLELMNAGLPSLINPMFLAVYETSSISPIFFDIVDYGICLFEKNDHVSNFRFSINRVKHKREMVNDVEVLTWQ